jgi:hypothetical protein
VAVVLHGIGNREAAAGQSSGNTHQVTPEASARQEVDAQQWRRVSRPQQST